ncbi:MAG TPA: gamma-glutamylcyclotransferase family protein [candidate division Zixibacteria bacterium]|nr:gamma-glutamylcyclotransferase family protein [candidate division Zixibacteria bacterium]
MYYFAYGSNMNWPQMQRRCPSATFVSVARLPDYRFAITRRSRLRGCGTANILRQPGAEVWGVVYDVAAPDLVVLDGFEDGYRRETVRVYCRDDGRRPLEALVYVAADEPDVPPPSAEYIGLIVEGAAHWKIPHPYLEMLRGLAGACAD